jgi:hypothetical protein
MKSNYLMLSAMLLFLSFGTTSCSSDDDGGSGGNAANGTVTAKIDGNNFQSQQMFSTANRVSAGGNTTLTLQGTDNSGKGFNFIINGYEGEGTYDIGGDNLVFVVANYIEANASNPTATQTWTAPFDDTTIRGIISFSSDIDENVKGTFEFTSKNPNDGSIKEITDGSFDLDVTSF